MSQLAPYETPQVRAALESAESSGVTAETAARSIGVARSLGLPSSVVVADLNYASREQEARKLESNPQLAQWTAASESNAAVAREDTDGLVAVFDAVANLGADVLHGITFGVPVAARKIGHSLTHGAADFNEGLAGAALLASENLFGERSLPAQWSRNALEWIERKRPPEVSADSSVAQFALDFVRSIPQQAGNIMATFVNPAATLGMMGTQIAGRDYVDLRKKGVSPGRSGVSSLLDATAQAPMERLALDRFLGIFKSTGFADTVKKVLGSSGTEFVTEYVQKAPELVSRLWGESEKHGSAPDEQIAWFARTLFNADTLLQAHNEAWYEASIASVWGLLGGVGRVALSAEARRTRAEGFAAQQRDLHAVIENSKTKQLSHEIMKSALDGAGLNRNASVPASTVIELYQNETDIITPLGWNLEDVQTAAALGQDIDVQLSHLHASLNQDQINAVSPFLREDADAPTIQETAIEADRVRESANAAAEEMARFQAEENEMDVELERLRTEMKDALGSVPGIQTSLKADATQEESARGQAMTPEKAAEYALSLHAAFARRLSAYGVNPAEYLRKVNVRGLVNEAREKGGMSRAQQRAALLESPIADTVYGRLDRAAIREAYGQDTVNAIVARYGKGVFAKTRGAKAVDRRMLSNDSLANELVRHGLLPEGSSLDDMVNYLATGEGVDTGRTLYQPEHEDWAYRGSQSEKSPDNDVGFTMWAYGDSERISHYAGDDYAKMWGINLKDAPNISDFYDAISERWERQRESGDLPSELEERYEDADTFLEYIDPDNIVDTAGLWDDIDAVDWLSEFFKEINVDTIRLWDGAISFNSESKRIVKLGEYSEELPAIQDNGTSGKMLFQTAYHGTPHRFDAFSLDAIGTGEGNQAHGWGLYFAKDREASEKYKNGLGVNITLDGKSFYDGVRGRLESSTGNKFADDTLLAFNGNIDEAIAELQDDVDYGMPEAVDALEVLQGIKADGRLKVEERGQLFEVDIPENDVLLDEQKTLEEQPEKVQSALRALAQEHGLTLESQYPSIETTESGKTFWIKHPGGWEPAGAPRFRSRAKAEQWLRDNPDAFVVIQDGKRIYNELATRLGSDRAASLALNDLGVKGITYDGAQDGRCFVVFDDKAIDILNKFFQTDSDPANARGKVELVGDDYLIGLFKKSDLSTLLHETGHVFLLEMDRLIKAGLGDERLQTDFDTIRAWLDAKPGEAFTREQHEKFARGFEAWLREGKAPARNLESAFARFKKWLTRIYRKVTELDVELTDDVRNVFSRLLATDIEIEAAARNSGLLDMDAKYLEALGVPEGAERVYASGLMKAVKDAGAARLRAARDADRKKQLADWSKKARQEIDDDPLYSAMRDLRKEPLDLDAVRESLGDELAERLRKRVPGGLKRGGKNPEVFAAEHGFQDGAGFMIDQMVDAPNVAERVRELLGEYQRIHDLLHDPADALLATEEAAAQAEFAGRYIARAAGSQAVEQNAVVMVVDESLQSMSMGKAVRANVFRTAMKRALERERRAVAQGDFAAALEANTQSRLNMEFAKRSADIHQGVEKLQKAVRKFSRSPRPASVPRYMVMALAAKYGLTRYDERLADGKSGEQIDAWLKEMENEGYPLSLDGALAEGESRPWRDMSVTEFESLASDLRQIMAVERNQRTVMTANGRKELDALADEIVAGIKANVPKNVSKVVGVGSTAGQFIAKGHSELLKVDTIARLLDGDKLGVTWQSIMRPINRATWNEAERFKKVRPELARIFSAFSPEEFRKMRSKREYVKEIGASMTREQRLAVLLNCGNEENMQRLMQGYDWNQQQVQAILAPLTERDWDFAQAVWDYVESFREESFGLEERLTGVRPKAVKASPLRSPFGKTYRGGYYPVKYDPAQSARAPDPGDVSTRPAGLFASVDHGFLKERSKLGLGAPLYLRLDVIPDHVAQTVHNLAFREPVMQVAKVLRNRKVQTAIQQAAGVQQYRRIWDMLKNVAGDSPKSMGSVDKVLSWARSNMALFTMGYKATTMAVQATGILSTVTEIGPKWTAVGVKRTYANPLRAYREATALSPMMANRIRNMEREVSEQMKRLAVGDGFAGLHAKLKRNAFTPMGIVQMGVDLPTWWGAYEKKMWETGGDERAAVEFADNVVEITQVGGAKKDLAGIQSGNEIAKMVTMFMSYFNALYNISTRRLTMAKRRKNAHSIGQLAATAILCWFMEPVLSEFLAGRGPDEDDGEEWGPWLAKQTLTNPLNMIPVVRDAVNYFIKDEVRSFTVSPAISGMEMILKAGAALGNAAVDAYNGEEFWNAQRGKALARGVGAATGSPFFNAQVITTVSNLWDWLDGTDPEFEIRDLFYVKPKSRR